MVFWVLAEDATTLAPAVSVSDTSPLGPWRTVPVPSFGVTGVCFYVYFCLCGNASTLAQRGCPRASNTILRAPV
jgi:hypothetical protein